MPSEEIQARVGFDLSGVDSGCKSWKDKTRDASEHVQKSFFRAESAGKQFKQVLRETYQESGILGAGLRLMLSPVAGAFALGVAAVKSFKDALQGLNARWDDISKNAAMRIGDMTASTKEAAKEIAQENREFDKWVKSHDDASQKIIDALTKRLSLLESESRINDKILGQEKERAVKAVHGEVASGKITKEQGAASVEKIETIVERRRQANAYNQVQSELKARESAAADLEKRKDSAGFEIGRLKKWDTDLTKRARENDWTKQVASLEQQKANTERLLEQNKQAIEQLGDPMSVGNQLQIILGDQSYLLNQAIRERASLTAQKEAIEKQIPKVTARRDSARDARIARQDLLKEAQTRYDEASGKIHGVGAAVDAAKLKRRELLAELTPEEQAAVIQQNAKDTYFAKRKALPKNATDAQKTDVTEAYKDLLRANANLPNGGLPLNSYQEMMQKQQKEWNLRLKWGEKDWRSHVNDGMQPAGTAKESATDIVEALAALKASIENIMTQRGIKVSELVNG